MAFINPNHSVSSRLLAPLQAALSLCASSRKCSVLEDFHWLTLGVERCLQSNDSGRGFLQSFSAVMPQLCPAIQHFFETLKSTRRLRMATEVNQSLIAQARKLLPDRLAVFSCLDGFEVFASDLHFHEHACHDKPNADGQSVSVGHLYCRNLRSGMVSHLSLAHLARRKAEHDMTTLKRASIDLLRQGTAKGTKVLHVYDCPSLRSRPAGWLRSRGAAGAAWQ